MHRFADLIGIDFPPRLAHQESNAAQGMQPESDAAQVMHPKGTTRTEY